MGDDQLKTVGDYALAVLGFLGLLAWMGLGLVAAIR